MNLGWINHWADQDLMEEDSFWAGNATNVSCQDFRQYEPEKWPWTGSMMSKKLRLAFIEVTYDEFSGALTVFESCYLKAFLNLIKCSFSKSIDSCGMDGGFIDYINGAFCVFVCNAADMYWIYVLYVIWLLWICLRNRIINVCSGEWFILYWPYYMPISYGT